MILINASRTEQLEAIARFEKLNIQVKRTPGACASSLVILRALQGLSWEEFSFLAVGDNEPTEALSSLYKRILDYGTRLQEEGEDAKDEACSFVDGLPEEEGDHCAVFDNIFFLVDPFGFGCTFPEMKELEEKYGRTCRPELDLWIKRQKLSDPRFTAKARTLLEYSGTDLLDLDRNERNDTRSEFPSRGEEHPPGYKNWTEDEGTNHLVALIQKYPRFRDLVLMSNERIRADRLSKDIALLLKASEGESETVSKTGSNPDYSDTLAGFILEAIACGGGSREIARIKKHYPSVEYEEVGDLIGWVKKRIERRETREKMRLIS